LGSFRVEFPNGPWIARFWRSGGRFDAIQVLARSSEACRGLVVPL